MPTTAGQTPKVNIVHSLLRARDWQDRPEFEVVRDWWRKEGSGVLALVGIGGAGKTAIANRLVYAIPELTDPPPGQVQDTSLPIPDGLFVISFYDIPNPDLFFNVLYSWLVEQFAEPDRRRVTDEGQMPATSTQVIDALSRVRRRLLLILDGMERVQGDGGRGEFGQLQDGDLREFLARAAAGVLRGLAVLVTTRFALSDMEYEYARGQAPLYRSLRIEEISDDACIALLRNRQPHGVRGNDDSLRALGQRCGRHALTVDLVGGYLVHFHGGDPEAPLNLPTGNELAQLSRRERDPWKQYVAEQSARFAGVTQSYHKALQKSDPAALALLQRLCLFRLGATVTNLATIFTGTDEAKRAISGPDLAILTQDELRDKLNLLVQMRLVEEVETPSAASDSSYTAHPAVRDGFLAGMGAAATRRGHMAVWEGLNAILGTQPGRGADAPTLDLVEEIIHHALAAGLTEKAWDLFKGRVVIDLLVRFGMYERIIRVANEFARLMDHQEDNVDESRQLDPECQSQLLMYRGVAFIELGRLAKAEACLRPLCAQDETDLGPSEVAEFHCHIVLLSSGKLKVVAESASKLSAAATSELFVVPISHAQAIAQLGGVEKSKRLFAAQVDGTSGKIPWHHIWHARLLGRLGLYSEAEKLSEHQETVLIKAGMESFANYHRLARAEVACASGNLAVASNLCSQVKDWATDRGARELLCWSALVRARIGWAEAGLQSDVRDFKSVRAALAEGVRIACECGYSIYHVDLLLIGAQISLAEGDPDAAERDIRCALYEGVSPNPQSGMPRLLAATDPECGYAWGCAEGYDLLGKTLLLRAAQELKKEDFVPARLNTLSVRVQNWITQGRENLEAALKLWHDLRDPDGADINPLGLKTQQALADLNGGILTELSVVTGKPAHDPTAPIATATPYAPPSPGPDHEAAAGSADALALWQKRLAFFQTELASEADAEDKFKLKQRIEEAEVMIQKLSK